MVAFCAKTYLGLMFASVLAPTWPFGFAEPTALGTDSDRTRPKETDLLTSAPDGWWTPCLGGRA